MSQKASRKGVVNEEKEKTDTPVKEMKKKMAANAEKEKQTAEKKETEKSADKPAEKNDKAADKPEKNDKAADKPEKSADKKSEKSAEKKAEKKADDPVEKKEESNKDDKSGKSHSGDQKKPSDRPKQNGRESRGVNGTANGEENGTVSAADDDDDDDAMVIDEGEHDDMFPELTYDDTSDAEFEPPTPDAAGSRSFTRRSQAKVTRTPETPRPASDKQPEKDADDSKDSKVLKLKEDAPPATDRKLRSADSPKPQDKKEKLQEKKAQESPKKDGKESETKEQEEKENGGKTDKAEADVVIEIDGGDEEPRKTDTNYSKSRVKVSPYRRSVRLADQTVSSMQANYTGNNTTMEMDITETTSSFLSEEASLDDSSYLSGLRSIRGRRSYKPLKEMALRHVANKSIPRAVNVSTSEQPSRPTAPVVGRKRKPEADDSVELGAEAAAAAHAHAHGKRARLLARLSQSLRRAASTPLPARRAAEIVGINTDLPLSAPVAQAGAFDPEALKPAEAPAAVPLAPAQPLPDGDRDNRRCVVM